MRFSGHCEGKNGNKGVLDGLTRVDRKPVDKASAQESVGVGVIVIMDDCYEGINYHLA